MKKKIISIILALSVSITMIRVNTIKSSAVDPTIITDLLRAIVLVTAGAVAGGAAMGLGDCLSEVIDDGLDTWYNETLPNKVTTAANNALNNDGIIVSNTSTGYYVSVNNSLTGDELEFATILAEKLNSHYDLDFLITSLSNSTGGISGYSFQMTAYEDLKTIIGQATAEFTQNKAIEYAKENGLTLIDNGALPLYKFDFVGPTQPGLEFAPIVSSCDKFYIDGCILTPSFTYKGPNVYKYPISVIESIGADVMQKYDDIYGYGRFSANDSYFLSQYYVVDGTVFYCPVPAQSQSMNRFVDMGSLTCSVLELIYNSEGVSLADKGFTSLDDLIGYQTGFYYTQLPDNNHVPTIPVNDFDNTKFTSSTTPGSVEIPRTEGEQAIIDGINLGLITENPDLTIDENGNIVKIDGIDTTKLMELLQTIANNGTISFDSVEEYLQTITQLIRVSNADTKTMNTVISNLNELTKAQNADIAAINANVASIAQALAISDTATADNTFDVDTPSTIIDKFPFCLPFDIQRVFNLLSAEPKAPSYDIPITMEGVFDYHITGDLSEYEWLAEIVRWVLYIVFIIGLIMITNKLIGRG